MSTTIAGPGAVDTDRLNALLGLMIGDLGATFNAGLVVLGDRLGLYRAMADGVPVTVEELARRTGTSAIYLRPWLSGQAAGGYVQYDPAAGTWSLTPEQSFVLAQPESPAFFAASMQLALATLRDVDQIEECFRTEAGFGWHEHDPELFEGTERFFRPGYVESLVGTWLPALDSVVAKLEAGGRVVDVGCGHGSSTVLMAQAFDRSTFLGVDYHEASITVARRRAAAAGLDGRVTFEVADASSLPPGSADLVTMFDCLHDLGDPAAAARAARGLLGADGTLMVVEPMAGDRIEDNLHPLGRVFYGASTMICTPCSLQQEGRRALGTQAGPAVLSSVLRDAGFGRVRVAATSPVNLVLEARP
ncbi:class I SAM-dependent methyltransferase [Microlunatus speluncae]|uniref:class I SAM-dependent methyltransferase n=1 Tax=Microlunatus speluncae TaxID=2594267 RepID=UPI0012663DFE|nr:class I SAM-dependent methyltransferase [Microlunatus speluncae]